MEALPSRASLKYIEKGVNEILEVVVPRKGSLFHRFIHVEAIKNQIVMRVLSTKDPSPMHHKSQEK